MRPKFNFFESGLLDGDDLLFSLNTFSEVAKLYVTIGERSS